MPAVGSAVRNATHLGLALRDRAPAARRARGTLPRPPNLEAKRRSGAGGLKLEAQRRSAHDAPGPGSISVAILISGQRSTFNLQRSTLNLPRQPPALALSRPPQRAPAKFYRRDIQAPSLLRSTCAPSRCAPVRSFSQKSILQPKRPWTAPLQLLANAPNPLSNNDLRAATAPGRGSVMHHKTRTKNPFLDTKIPFRPPEMPRLRAPRVRSFPQSAIRNRQSPINGRSLPPLGPRPVAKMNRRIRAGAGLDATKELVDGLCDHLVAVWGPVLVVGIEDLVAIHHGRAQPVGQGQEGNGLSLAPVPHRRLPGVRAVEQIRQENFRGGQVFFVLPRHLKEAVP